MSAFFRLFFSLALLGAISVFACARATAQDVSGVRVWTNNIGEETKASLITFDDKKVTLDRKDGTNLVTIAIPKLSFEDQAFLAGVKAFRATDASTKTWPGKTFAPVVNVVALPEGRRYQTEHFDLLSENEADREFLEAAASVLEGTLAAIEALPFDIRPKPPTGLERFATVFNAPDNLKARIVDRFRVHPEEPRHGAYLGRQGILLASYTGFGGVKVDDRVTLDPTLDPDTSTLIHELSHQIMDGMLRTFPHWFNEGLSEYLAMIPQSAGNFRFDEAEAGLKTALKDRYHAEAPEMIHPRDIMTMDNPSPWDTSLDGYRSTMLLIYYLIHLENGKKGEPVAKMIRTLRAIDDRAWGLIAEYNAAVKEFGPKSEEYNAAIDRYNKEVNAYRKQAATNGVGSPVRVGGGEAGDGAPVVVGSIGTVRPVMPKRLEIPDVLQHRRDGKPVDIASFSGSLSMQAIMQGRDYDQLAAAIVRGYERIGITVTILPAKSAAQ